MFYDWTGISNPKTYRFYDYTSGHIWTGYKKYDDSLVSYDNGQTWVK